MSVTSLHQDIRQAFRSLLHQKGFTAAALLSLALGTGATIALFSVVYGVLLRPLPYPDADRLVRLSEYHPGASASVRAALFTNFTYHAWSDPRTIEGLAAFSNETFTETSGEEPVKLVGASLTPSTFKLLGTRPALGRLLDEGDAKETSPRVAVLSDGLWKERFGGDPSVIGKTLILDGTIHTVVGVAPPEFYFPRREARLWTSYAIPRGSADPDHQSIRLFGAIAKLKAGVTLEQAAGEGTIAARSVPRPPVADAIFGKGGPVAVKVETLLSEMTTTVRPALLLLASGVGLILLIACANVASLQLTRGVSRQREIAVRSALGAGRGRLMRQLVTESLVLSALGGACGLLLGSALLAALPSFAPANFPRLPDIALDRTALAFAAGVALVSGLLSGLLPAWRSARIGVASALRDGSGASASVATQRLRSALVAGEAALAVMLLIGAALLARSFSELLQVDPGYDIGNVLIARLDSGGRPQPDDQALDHAQELLARVRALPGVEAAGVGNMTPLDFATAVSSFELPDARAPEGKVQARAIFYTVTPGFGEALSLRLKEGRLFGAPDETSAIESVLVNEEFARVYLNDGKPVVSRRYEGLFRRAAGAAATTEIVGVVGNVLKDGFDAEPMPAMFALPRFGRRLPSGFQLVVRTSSEASALPASVRAIIRQLDPGATVETALLSTRVAASVAQPRFAALTLGVFALLALSLAAFGLYAAMSYNVTQRKRELGVRTALGATRRDIVGLILRQGMRVAVVGLGTGVLAATFLSRLLEKLLFGVTPLDPLAFASAPGLLLIAALLACLVPAWRGASVEPTEALRCE